MTLGFVNQNEYMLTTNKDKKDFMKDFKIKSNLAKLPFIILVAIIFLRFAIPGISLPYLWVYFYLVNAYSVMLFLKIIWCVWNFGKWTKDQDKATNKPHKYTAKHLVIITIYKEPVEVILETLAILANTSSSSRMTVVLAMEERDVNARQRSASCIEEFKGKFESMIATFHPGNIEGEQPGKGSNEAWAFKKVVMEHPYLDQSIGYGHVKEWDLVHILDVDTHHKSEYFRRVEFLWANLSKEDQEKAIFSCPIQFNRNHRDVAWPVTIIDTFWSIAALTTLYPGSNFKSPLSTYSASVVLTKKTGGWDADAFALGEDIHFILKNYFETEGDICMVPVYVPASSLHIDNGRVSTKGWIGDIHARFDQGLRHLWASLEFSYVINEVIKRPHLLVKEQTWVILLKVCEITILPIHTIVVPWMMLWSTKGFAQLLLITQLNGVLLAFALILHIQCVQKVWGRQYSKIEIILKALGTAVFGVMFTLIFMIIPLLYSYVCHLFYVNYGGWKTAVGNFQIQSTKQKAEEYIHILEESTDAEEKVEESF